METSLLTFSSSPSATGGARDPRCADTPARDARLAPRRVGSCDAAAMASGLGAIVVTGGGRGIGAATARLAGVCDECVWGVSVCTGGGAADVDAPWRQRREHRECLDPRERGSARLHLHGVARERRGAGARGAREIPGAAAARGHARGGGAGPSSGCSRTKRRTRPAPSWM